jgi:hypothetical protein
LSFIFERYGEQLQAAAFLRVPRSLYLAFMACPQASKYSQFSVTAQLMTAALGLKS